MTNSVHPITTGIAWCLAWGDKREPQLGWSAMQSIKKALNEQTGIPDALQPFVEQVTKLDDLKFPETAEELSQIYEKLQQDNPKAWNTPIGLVYGGATKIKQYVFEAAKLPDIRGASGLLDRINLIDLPAFFKCEESSDFPECHRARSYCQKVRRELQDKDEKLQQLWEALIPELVIYSTGGNILAFCPTAFVNNLTNLIEKRYTEETLTANSCAVGDTFRLLEIRFGLLNEPIEQTKWLDWYLEDKQRQRHPIVEAYFGRPEESQNWEELFKNRKNFNEVTGKLAALFQKRRNGNDLPEVKRPSRCYPPMFETHPYLVRDESNQRSAIVRAIELPGEPWFSETLARKRLTGEITKRQVPEGQLPEWYKKTKLEWEPGEIKSWVYKFELFLLRSERWRKYYEGFVNSRIEEARSLTEIGNASNGFVGYIYADGNNMGGYIQKQLKNPEDYRRFSRDIFTATEESVYKALEQHLHPHELKGLTGEHQHRNGAIIHPFEILTIGGDDVMLIVPADKALAIAKTIGEQFEKILLKQVALNDVKIQGDYQIKSAEKPINPNSYHRYSHSQEQAEPSSCQLSMSIGVLITAYKTPFYYAKYLTEQLLKSAKKYAKTLKKLGYCGGTGDFLVLKGVTMISSNIEEFRQEALTKERMQKLKFYAAPYTLHELGGLIKSISALKRAKFPRSQLYQIRSLLERGKHTAILNYRYFRVRLKQGQIELKEDFEEAWCKPKDEKNKGNLAPWTSLKEPDKSTTYETIWHEMVDLYDFIDLGKESESSQQQLTKQEADS